MTGLEKMYCAMCLYKYVQYNAYRMVGLVDRGRGICECIRGGVNATKVHGWLPFQCVDGVGPPPPSCQKGVPVLAEVSG